MIIQILRPCKENIATFPFKLTGARSNKWDFFVVVGHLLCKCMSSFIANLNNIIYTPLHNIIDPPARRTTRVTIYNPSLTKFPSTTTLSPCVFVPRRIYFMLSVIVYVLIVASELHFSTLFIHWKMRIDHTIILWILISWSRWNIVINVYHSNISNIFI